MQYDEKRLAQAITQTTGNKVALANTPEEGEIWAGAIRRAIDEIFYNESIRFDGVKLTYVSRERAAQAIVTKNGCHHSCICKGLISKHIALFEIVSRYYALEAEQMVEGAREIVKNGAVETTFEIRNGRRVRILERFAAAGFSMITFKLDKEPRVTPPTPNENNVVVFRSKPAKKDLAKAA